MAQHYTLLPLDKTVPAGSDYAVKIENAHAEPYFHDGDTVFVDHRAELVDGDVGIFLVGREMLLRQYCEDSFGNLYLFTLDRASRALDLTIPSSAPPTICFGKVLIAKPIPLPR